jgi:hypothetical protein
VTARPNPTQLELSKQDTVYACIDSEGAGGVVLNTEVILDADQQPVGLSPPTPVSFTRGLCFCHLNKAKNRIHRIQTAAGNTSTLEFIGAEVLPPAPPVAAGGPLAPHPCYVTEPLDHPRARAYRVTAPPGGATGPVKWGLCGVVRVLRGAPAAAALEGGRRMRPGDAFWFQGPVQVDVTAGGDEAVELLVVEWTG